eukprot:355064-Prymnesium_polylepis.1
MPADRISAHSCIARSVVWRVAPRPHKPPISVPNVMVSSGTFDEATLACWKACNASRCSPHSMHVASQALSATVSTHCWLRSRSQILRASSSCIWAPKARMRMHRVNAFGGSAAPASITCRTFRAVKSSFDAISAAISVLHARTLIRAFALGVAPRAKRASAARSRVRSCATSAAGGLQ